MDKSQTDLIIKVNNQYKHMRDEDRAFHTMTHITSYVFDETVDLDYREIGVLVCLSRFNVWTPASVGLRTMLVNMNMIAASMKLSGKTEIKLIINGMEGLISKGVIDLNFANPLHTVKDLWDYKLDFYVTQKFYTHLEKYDEETFQAFDGISMYKEFNDKRATVGLYLEELDKILDIDTIVSNKIKLFAIYAAICKPIYYSAYNSDEKKKSIDVKKRAVNWNRIEDIGRVVRFNSLASIRKHIKTLVSNEVIARIDLRFGGNTLLHTRVYFSRYADAVPLMDVVIYQIKEKKVYGIIENDKV